MKRRAFLQATMGATAITPFAARPSLARLYRMAAAAPRDLDAVGGDGRSVVVKGAPIQDLTSSLNGRLLLADSAGYETARHVLNPGIDKRPALIVQPTAPQT